MTADYIGALIYPQPDAKMLPICAQSRVRLVRYPDSRSGPASIPAGYKCKKLSISVWRRSG